MKRWLCEKAGGEDVPAALPYGGLSAGAPAKGTPRCLPGAGKGRSQQPPRHPSVTAPACHPMQPSARVCHQPPREMQPYRPPSWSQLTGYQLPSQFSQRPSNKLNSHVRVSASSHRSCLLNYRLTTVWGSSLPSGSCKKNHKIKIITYLLQILIPIPNWENPEVDTFSPRLQRDKCFYWDHAGYTHKGRQKRPEGLHELM